MELDADWELLDWDTRSFGFRTARINPGVDADRLPQVVATMEEAKVVLAYLMVPPTAEAVIRAAGVVGGTCVDRKSTFMASVGVVLDSTEGRGVPVFEERGALTPDLRQLSLDAGEYSRFRVDPRFPAEAFEMLYTRWIERSLTGEIAEGVFITRDNGGPTGMVTVGRKDGRADIGLIAVSPRARGRGLASGLVRRAAEWGRSLDITDIQVVTQGENGPACSLYRRCGLTLESVTLVFHFWLAPERP